jgi:predicted  nucleic acid-binding Zn-ribbon protein
MGKTQKLVDKEKMAFEKTMGNIKRLSEDINTYVKKFDMIKEEIDSSNKKYETYKIDMETRRQQVALLECQIQNVILMGQLKDKQ